MWKAFPASYSVIAAVEQACWEVATLNGLYFIARCEHTISSEGLCFGGLSKSAGQSEDVSVYQLLRVNWLALLGTMNRADFCAAAEDF